MPLLSEIAQRKKIEFFLAPLAKNAAILEIGCGSLWVGDYLRANGYSGYVGNDLVPPADIVGDIKHSRVARSDVLAFTSLGAEVTLVAPPTLLPPSLEGWPVSVSHDLDAILPKVDIVYLLRMQRERMTSALVPSLREYTSRYGLTRRRVDRLDDAAIVMHPGPMNRGVEIAADVADLPRSVIVDQVRNGVAVRMAVLYLLLGSGSDKVLQLEKPS